jgi:hypothetical protein
MLLIIEVAWKWLRLDSSPQAGIFSNITCELFSSFYSLLITLLYLFCLDFNELFVTVLLQSQVLKRVLSQRNTIE